MPRRVTEEDKEVIRQMIEEEGATLQEVGEALGSSPEDTVSKQAVWYHAQKMGLQKPEDEERVELRDTANALLSEKPDITIKALSGELDCSWQVAKTLMKELGFYEKTPPFVERVNAKRLIELYVVEDMSLAELSEVFPDVSEMTISKTLKELSVPMRPQGGASGELRTTWRKEAMASLGLSEPEEAAS